MKTTDKMIRKELVRALAYPPPSQHLPKRIVHEMNIALGKTRVDVALITEEAMNGYEIKSGRDKLDRLVTQALNYSKIFDYSTAVIDERHLVDITGFLPDWWGIIVAYQKDDVISFDNHRVPTPSPIVDVKAITRLLWREEALALLRTHNLQKGLSQANRATLTRTLVGSLDLDVLKSAVRYALINRKHWQRSGRYPE